MFCHKRHKFRGGTVVGWWGGTEIHRAVELCRSAKKYEEVWSGSKFAIVGKCQKLGDSCSWQRAGRWSFKVEVRKCHSKMMFAPTVEKKPPGQKCLEGRGQWRGSCRSCPTPRKTRGCWCLTERKRRRVQNQARSFWRRNNWRGRVLWIPKPSGSWEAPGGRSEIKQGGICRDQWSLLSEKQLVVRMGFSPSDVMLVLMMLDIFCVLIPAATVGKVLACRYSCHCSCHRCWHFQWTHWRQIHQLSDTQTHQCLHCGLNINVIACSHFNVYCHHSPLHVIIMVSMSDKPFQCALIPLLLTVPSVISL